MKNKDAKAMLAFINPEKLNDWEKKFIESISESVGDGLDLTYKQSIKIQQIYARLS